MVAALYTAPGSVYLDILGAEACWPETRDARTYAGPWPVVAHPPCFKWVNLAAVNFKRYGEHMRPAWYPGGTDGGCFAAALAAVRQWGGALEHPAGSHAWNAHGLLRPGPSGWWRPTDREREAVCEVWQSAYGHPARKRTWLLYVGDRAPFDLDWTRQPGSFQCGWFDRNKPTLSKPAALATPRAFAETLIALARHSRSTCTQLSTF
jgi:hypothetical protein